MSDDELIDAMLVAMYDDGCPGAVDSMRAVLAVVRAHDRDGERWRFITEDHADSSVRARIREISNRLPVMSYAAASAAIDAAIADSCGVPVCSEACDREARREHDGRDAWQPIETAPSDTVVLLYTPHLHGSNPERIEVRVYHDSRAGTRHAWATQWKPIDSLIDAAQRAPRPESNRTERGAA